MILCQLGWLFADILIFFHRRSHRSTPRPESEYVPPPVYLPPEITRSTQPANHSNKSTSDIITRNMAYNFSSSNVSLRDDTRDDMCSTINGAYGVSPVNFNLTRNVLRPDPPTNPPPVYYDRASPMNQ